MPTPARGADDVASFPYFGESEFLRYNAKFQLMVNMLMKKDQAVLDSPYYVAASNTLTIPASHSFVFLKPQTAAITAYRVALDETNPEVGQLLYIFNQSASEASIVHAAGNSVATCSASGGVAHLFFASGSWRLLEDQ
jgi:hypothetical protein